MIPSVIGCALDAVACLLTQRTTSVLTATPAYRKVGAAKLQSTRYDQQQSTSTARPDRSTALPRDLLTGVPRGTLATEARLGCQEQV
jgi:hypothetical protein